MLVYSHVYLVCLKHVFKPVRCIEPTTHLCLRSESRVFSTAIIPVVVQATLYVLDRNTIRTYDAETGEFLEVFTSHDGMDGTYLLFHDM